MLALSPTAAALHTQHVQRQQRFAAASTRHAENISLQRAAAKAELEQSLQTLPPQVQPVVTEDPQDTWLKFQYKMFTGPIDAAPVDIRKIQNVVADHYGVSRLDMISARRAADIVLPRQVAMYLAKTLTLRSLPEIGRRFGGRDHTTVLHAVRKYERLIAKDASIAATIYALTVALS
jgi:hypothetical protein